MTKQYVIRTKNAGAWFGEIISRHGDEVVMCDAIRLWYWDGAASLSQLAAEGVKAPENCKFAMPVNVTLLGVIEIIDATDEAVASVRGVMSWTR